MQAPQLDFPRPLPPRAGPRRQLLSHEAACEAGSEPGPPARSVSRGSWAQTPAQCLHSELAALGPTPSLPPSHPWAWQTSPRSCLLWGPREQLLSMEEQTDERSGCPRAEWRGAAQDCGCGIRDRCLAGHEQILNCIKLCKPHFSCKACFNLTSALGLHLHLYREGNKSSMSLIHFYS